MKLLIVEDDGAVARAISRILRKHGYEITHVASYAQGLAQSETFDCGVFDVELPDGSGIALADELRETGRVKSIVFFTASPDATIARRAQKIGAFVHKTEGPAELAAAVADALASLPEH